MEENIYVIGRYKELIKYRMAHVSTSVFRLHCVLLQMMSFSTVQVVPSNIEKHLLTHAAVEDAAVVGRPHDVDGELPTAFVVVRAGHSVTADELVRFIDGQYHLSLICISISGKLNVSPDKQSGWLTRSDSEEASDSPAESPATTWAKSYVAS